MIVVDCAEIERAQRTLHRVPGGAHKAIARTLNRAVQSGKVSASKSVRKTHLLQPRKLSEALTVNRADSGLVASLVARGKPRALTYYKVKLSHPLYAQVKKNGGGHIPNGFVVTMKSGHKGVFVRKQNESRRLKELYGPSVPGIMKNQDVKDAFYNQAQETFSERLPQEVIALLRGYAR